MRCPTIVSIATLRGVNPNVPITVLDKSETPQDWGEFPEKLNFDVAHDPTFSCERYKNVVAGYKHLSRFPDLVSYTKDKDERVVYVDADVFWFRDPFPLAVTSSKLCIDGWNTGFFYYEARYANKWFDPFEAYMKSAIYSEELRDVLKQHVNYDDWYVVFDEQIITYLKKTNPQLIEIIPDCEHITGSRLEELDPDTAKMLHFNGIMVHDNYHRTRHARGLAGIIIQEFYDNICKSLDASDIEKIFTPHAMRLYGSKRFSLFRNLARLLETKTDRLYRLDKCLSVPRLDLI